MEVEEVVVSLVGHAYERGSGGDPNKVMKVPSSTQSNMVPSLDGQKNKLILNE